MEKNILYKYPLIYCDDEKENQNWNGEKDLVNCRFINYLENKKMKCKKD